MSDVVVVKGDDGKLAGLGEKGRKAFEKFRRAVEQLEPGETMRFVFKLPRSPQHHRLFFAKIARLLDRQEQFDDLDKLRKWLTVGAGYCQFVPGPSGRMVAMPDSIAWENLDEADFVDLHSRVDAFLYSEHARRFLWPHLSDEQSYALVEQFMQEFSS